MTIMDGLPVPVIQHSQRGGQLEDSYGRTLPSIFYIEYDCTSTDHSSISRNGTGEGRNEIADQARLMEKPCEHLSSTVMAQVFCARELDRFWQSKDMKHSTDAHRTLHARPRHLGS